MLPIAIVNVGHKLVILEMKLKEKIVIPSLTWDSVKKLDATTTFPWEFPCYNDRERKTKPITQSKRIVFDVKM